MTTETDILQEIPDEDLPTLAEMYEKHEHRFHYAYSTILTGIKVRKSHRRECFIFLSPNNCWKQDGTFVALFTTYNSYVTLAFTLEETCKNLSEALRKTKKIVGVHVPRPEGAERLFYALHGALYSPLKSLLDQTCLEKSELFIMKITKEEALNLDTSCPLEVYMKKLDASHASTINDIWPERYQYSHKYVTASIETSDSYGVFTKNGDELVAWCVESPIGQLTMLQTKENHKRKGYATTVLKFMCKERAKKGFDSIGTVFPENVPSLSMFEKIGFRKVDLCYYLSY